MILLSHNGEFQILYDYERLLQRLYESLPTSGSKASRFELQQLVLERVGSKTLVRNFKQVSDSMRREPRVVMRYLLKELGVSGSYDDDSGILTINTRVSSATLENLMNRFIKIYVICPTCGSADTRLERRDKTWVLVCEACGAEQPVPPL